MKYLIAVIVFFLSISKANGFAEIIVNPQYGYGVINILGGDKVPTYKGNYIGADVEYKFSTTKVGIGLYASVAKGNYENTANTPTQREDLDLETHSFGIKVYYHQVFLKAGFGRVSLDNVTNSDTNSIIHMADSVYSVGIGYVVPIFSNLRMNLGVEVKYAKFDPTPEGVSDRADFYHYGAYAGLEFILPSIPMISK